MIASAILLLLSSAFWMLRIGNGVGSFPRPLSAQEERECIDRALAGDMEARNKLIVHNLRLVAHIMKKYYTQTSDQEDLISIGTIGLIKGISSYRPERGVRLATYASKCIENAILTRATLRMAGHAPADTVPRRCDYRLPEVLFVWRTECENLEPFVIGGGRKTPEQKIKQGQADA